MERIKALVRDVPDFPVPGIIFKDITPVLKDPEALGTIIEEFRKKYASLKIDAIVGIESRGFIIGTPLALALKVPFVPIRKVGKLPFDKISVSYKLEYGEATIEMHTDALEKGDRVIIVDDLLATGGTTAASIVLVEKLGAEVLRCAFVIELGFLNGRKVLPEGKVDSLIVYD
ncbi:MAG: adenine phosphoribosyltransferase [Candidatus Thermoplasmatota archaeon]|nr:adenine phosphoribosyltransferase [Euryarchaeota archaeon]MBU4032099.1 adenine phosphoribosyltransferase [Candidatus Thermoplasmatota archaeon]MBU4072288.1 adenine phosphoribosyltransferase [Candidatus Thermoplasmatota archaeon]MBU4144321.1 adenine phosphoribosyltransferase [Candidatus Thermoplasmatota archaeon]MBU4592589.1 adenine phosphoribosyltransferase [Candidatus Thermoplasmatota archaeon]